MKFCSGRNCPIQYDPERGFDFSKCKAFKECQYATVVDTDSINWIDILSLLAIAKRNEITDGLQKLKEAMNKDIEERAQKLSEICPAPKPYVIQEPCSCCKVTTVDNGYKTDCYYYLEEQHMNAHIPYCSVNNQYESRNCNEQCPNYITHEQVNQLVKEHLATRKELEDIKNG